MVSFSQTEPDTCPPVFLNIRIENALNDIGPKPVIELNDTFDLCLYLFPLKKQNYNKLCRSLEKDEINIMQKNYSEDPENLLIGVRITKERFEHIFKGIVEYRNVPAGSFSGYLWQIFVKSYNIPDKYKNIIKSISVTDPQTGGC